MSAAERDPAATERRARLADLLARQAAVRSAALRPELPPIQRYPGRRSGREPVSFAQERLCFLQKLFQDSPVYNNPVGLRLSGPVDTAQVRRTIEAVVARHEILRTRFEFGVEGIAQIVLPTIELPYAVIDLTSLPPSDREGEMQRLATSEAQRPFDIESGPLFAVRLFVLGPLEHVVFLNMHHLITDAWSLGVFVREVLQLYEAFTAGRPSPLSPLPIQYADFARWQREWVSGDVLRRQLDYWQSRLHEAETLTLPLDRPRPPHASFCGARIMRRLPAPLTASLRQLCGSENVTLFQLILTAFKVVLHRYSGQNDIVIGTPVTNRARAEIEGLIGVFVNTLVLRTRINGSLTFREALRRVRDTVLGAFENQDLPFEKLVGSMRADRSLDRAPFFQVMFGFPQVPLRSVRFGGVDVSLYEVHSETAKFDIALSMTDWLDHLGFSIEYKTELFDTTTIQRLLDHIVAVLVAAVTNPDQKLAALQLLSQTERQRLLVEWNRTDRGSPCTVPAAFAERAAACPDARAIQDAAGSYSYRALHEASNAVAMSLLAMGVREEQCVAICMDRSRYLAVAVLGVLKAGAAFVPLEIGVPAQRLAAIVQNADARVILADTSLRDAFPKSEIPTLSVQEAIEKAPHGLKLPVVNEGSVAYAVYTSGSNGQSKGVLVEHGSLARYLAWVNAELLGPRQEAVPMTSSLAFDMCLKQFLAPLVRGDAVWMLPMATVASPQEVWSALGSRDKVGINCVPSLWSAMLAAVESGEVAAASSLRLLVLGGEHPSEGLLARTWRLFPEIEVINVYGPTEATSNATWATLRPNDRITVGRPIWNTRVYVLDADGGLSPTGIVGEVCLGGKNLARGYLNGPELTAEKFVADMMTNEPGARLYRTGDRGRIDADGRLELVGRTDELIKLRGFRIELGEIRTALTALPAIEDAAVVVHGEGDQRRLLAYVVPRPDTKPDAASLMAALRERLPDYMIPSIFVSLSALPRLANGKVDVRSLPDSTLPRLPVGAPYQAPRTEVESTIAEVWREVLGVDRVGVHDGFFELGGHSLLMLQVQSKLRVRFGRDIRVVELFKNPTIDSLARCLTEVEVTAAFFDDERARKLGRGRSALSSLRARAGKEGRTMVAPPDV